MRSKVLATSWHPGGMNAILPVIKKIQQDNIIDITVVGHEYSEAILDAQGIDYKRINDYGLDCVSLDAMISLLEQETPDLILTGTSTQDEDHKDVIEQTITLAGRNNEIPTVAVLDVWGNYSLRFNDMYTGEDFKFLPDKIAIMDQYAEEDMIREGFDSSRLVITGNPHFDNLRIKAEKFTEKEKIEFRKQVGLETDIIFFYAGCAWKKWEYKTGFWDLDNIKLVNETLRELSDNDGKKYGLVVKLHPRVPSEDVEGITSYISRECKDRISLVDGIHPHDLILASDLTLTPYSTLGIETVYMGKACISIQPNLQINDFLSILTKNEIIPVGYTVEDCKSLVKRAYIDQGYREKELIQQASSFRIGGEATERVTQLVYQLLISR
jgi:hypothetical protein